MTQLDNSCSSRMRGWPLGSAAGFAGLVPLAHHLVGCLTGETEGEKERTVTEAAWQKYPSNCQSKISEQQPRTNNVWTISKSSSPLRVSELNSSQVKQSVVEKWIRRRVRARLTQRHPRHVVTLPWHAGNNGRGPRTRRAVLRRTSLPPHAPSCLKLTLSKRSTMKTLLAFLPRLNSLRPSPRSKKRR